MATRVYIKMLHAINGRGVLFAVAYDVKITALAPAVIAELAKVFPALAWAEAESTSQAVKNRIFV
jgi:hypothetical protein